MSQDNLTTIQSLYASLVRMDSYEDIEAIVKEYADPDIRWHPIEATGPVFGLEALRKSLEDWFETMAEFEVELEELIDLDEEHVLAATRQVARGKASGVAAEQRVFSLYRLRSGRVIRFREFTEKADALQAAGTTDGD
jgi:ketosteroid isomerase-like protein